MQTCSTFCFAKQEIRNADMQYNLFSKQEIRNADIQYILFSKQEIRNADMQYILFRKTGIRNADMQYILFRKTGNKKCRHAVYFDFKTVNVNFCTFCFNRNRQNKKCITFWLCKTVKSYVLHFLVPCFRKL